MTTKMIKKSKYLALRKIRNLYFCRNFSDLILKLRFFAISPQMKRSRLRPDSAEQLMFLHHNAAKFDQIRKEDNAAQKARNKREAAKIHEEFIGSRENQQLVLNFCYLNIS